MAQSKPDTLVILTPGFPKDEDDSACLPPQQIFVKALRDVNPVLNIIVLTFTYPFFSGTYYWNGVKVTAFGNKRSNRLKRLFTPLRVYLTLLQIRQQHKVVGLLSFWMGKTAVVGNWFARNYRMQHYIWVLGQDAKQGNRYIKWIRPKAEQIIALSDFIVRQFEQNYNIRPKQVVPVGIDKEMFDNVIAVKNIDVMAAGSLIPLKQYDVFIEVINQLKMTRPGIKAIICGDGVEMQMLRDKVQQYDLTDNIIFTGQIAHQQVLALMQRAKVFLHPSAYEGFGAVCLEALYAGAKVISFVKPMDTQITNWYIAKTTDEMVGLANDFLNKPSEVSERVCGYEIHDNARLMLALFNQSEAAISSIPRAMALNDK